MGKKPAGDDTGEVDVRLIVFSASLPPIQSAISLDGHGDGARIKFDVPRSDVGAVLLLQHFYTGQSFKVTIERVDDQSTAVNTGQRKATY